MTTRVFDRSDPEFVVITHDDTKQAVPVCCPICQFCLRTNEDENRMISDGCCAACGLRFVDPDKERWHNGWRPDSTAVENASNERQRIMLTFAFD